MALRNHLDTLNSRTVTAVAPSRFGHVTETARLLRPRYEPSHQASPATSMHTIANTRAPPNSSCTDSL